MYVVAVGAEIPDTIQSVTVARRGYGVIGLGVRVKVAGCGGKYRTPSHLRRHSH